jgi:hydrogenase maturation protein HypF
LAEHGRSGPAIGVIYDGSGYGPDGTVWGGELLVGELTGFERAGHLWPVRLPGADRAVSQPWRMACAWLVEACGDPPPRPRNLAALVDGEAWEAVARLAREGPNSPVTTSVGRLFDAVAALCGIRAVVSYEGQAAAELEALADPDERGEYPLAVAPDLRLDARELIRAVADDLRAGASLGAVSVRFHRALATATAQACAILAELHGMPTVVLAGGVFQNRLLLELSTAALDARRLDVILPERLPPNDGAVSYGQAAVAAATIAQASGGVPVRALA